ncbi:SPOSA6832_03091, partial [Sporobolomyces salmonicolor]
SLGRANLLKSCGALLNAAGQLEGSEETLAARTELCRVVGNMCFDHDPNRQQTLDAGIPRSMARVLAGTTALEGRDAEGRQRELRVPELKCVRAAVGAMLNSSLKFDPIRCELTKAEILCPLLALLDARPSANNAAPVYVVGAWAADPSGDVEEWKERLELGSTIASWVMNILEDVLGESILSLSSILLSIFTTSPHPHPSALSSHWSFEEASDFLDTDIELLSISAALLEGLSIDLDSIKELLAFSTFNPSLSSPDSSLLEHLLAFIRSSAPPQYWQHATDDPDRAAKAFSTVKAAVIRAVVEAPNSDVVMERLWKDTSVEGGKSWIVEKLVLWLEEAQQEGREDMLICAAHMLAGLGRRDEHTEALVHDYGLAAPLASIVQERVDQQLAPKEGGSRPGETTQILYGVVSLLRHLAIPVKNRQVVGETGVIPSLAQLLRRELDIVQPLQMSLPLDAILALISRTDEVRLRSEASRILVNLVRSLFSTKLPSMSDSVAASPISPSAAHAAPSEHVDEEELLRRRGRPTLVRTDVVEALSEMVRLSEKYPMLINEGVVGLTLLAGSGQSGARLVLSALVASHTSPLPSSSDAADPTPSASTSADELASLASPTAAADKPKRATSLAITSAGDPPCSIDMLATWLGLCASGKLSLPSSSSSPSAPPAGIRPEMVANACALMITVLKNCPEPDDRDKVDELRRKVLGPLKGAVEAIEGGTVEVGAALATTARRARELVERK